MDFTMKHIMKKTRQYYKNQKSYYPVAYEEFFKSSARSKYFLHGYCSSFLMKVILLVTLMQDISSKKEKMEKDLYLKYIIRM